MRPLWPPLTVIKSNLFASLEFRSVHDEKSVSKTIEVADIEVPPMPAFLSELIQKRVKTQTTTFSPVPTPGQILLINLYEKEIIPSVEKRTKNIHPFFGGWKIKGGLWGKDSSSKRNNLNPLTILLDKPTNIGNVWAGWLVAAETDYASYWDMLLEPEDEPYDPLAGMIQVWNPIQITIPAETKVLAELKPIRLQAVRALAEEYETGVVSQDENGLPGHIAPRDTLGGFSVLTGTLLGDKNIDPRYEYQTLYHEVAKAIPVVEREQYDWTEHLKALYQKWVKLLPAEQMVPATLAAGVVLGLVINMMMFQLTTVPSEGQIGEDSSIILRGDPDTTAEKPVSEQVNEIIEDLGDSPPDEWINEIVEKLYEGEIAVAKELLGQFQIRYPDYTGE